MDYSRLTKVAAPALFLAAAAGLSLLFRKKPALTLLRSFSHSGKPITLLQGDPSLCESEFLIIPNTARLTFESPLSHIVLKAAGPVLARECNSWVLRFNALIPGECAVTGGGNLAVKNVIHVVPPQSSEPDKLELALSNAVEMAAGLGPGVISLTEVGWRRDFREEEYARVLVCAAVAALQSASIHGVQIIIRSSHLLPALTTALSLL